MVTQHESQEAIRPVPQTPVDHVFVRKAIRWIRNTRDEAALKVLSEDLADYLEVHFNAEEAAGGLFDSITTRAPHRQRVVDELETDHKKLLAEMRGLAAELTDTPQRASAEVVARATALATWLEEHERREESLLQDCLERDLDGGN